MSTRKTTHYGLHLWEPEDKFVRSEFNENSEKVDAAARAAWDRAGQVLGNLEPLSYDVFNLLLQNYYDGRYTGNKGALLFDGFLNAGGLSYKSLSFTHSADYKCLSLTQSSTATTQHSNGAGYVFSSATADRAGAVTDPSDCTLAWVKL